jgi:hypothetical protein
MGREEKQSSSFGREVDRPSLRIGNDDAAPATVGHDIGVLAALGQRVCEERLEISEAALFLGRPATGSDGRIKSDSA